MTKPRDLNEACRKTAQAYGRAKFIEERDALLQRCPDPWTQKIIARYEYVESEPDASPHPARYWFLTIVALCLFAWMLAGLAVWWVW